MWHRSRRAASSRRGLHLPSISGRVREIENPKNENLQDLSRAISRPSPRSSCSRSDRHRSQAFIDRCVVGGARHARVSPITRADGNCNRVTRELMLRTTPPRPGRRTCGPDGEPLAGAPGMPAGISTTDFYYLRRSCSRWGSADACRSVRPPPRFVCPRGSSPHLGATAGLVGRYFLDPFRKRAGRVSQGLLAVDQFAFFSRSSS